MRHPNIESLSLSLSLDVVLFVLIRTSLIRVN